MTNAHYRTGWYIPGQVVYGAVWGTVSVEDLVAYLKSYNQYIKQTDRPWIHIVAHYGYVVKPPTIVEMGKYLPMLFKENSRIGWSITLGENDMIMKMASNVGQQMLKLRQKMFPTMEETIHFLSRVDPDLDWSRVQPEVIAEVMPTVEERALMGVRL